MKQEKINTEVNQILERKEKGFTPEELELFTQYEPSEGTNKLYSFFTPDWVCDVMVQLAIRYGYEPNKHKVLEPACGTGNFITALPNHKLVTAFELDERNYRIAKALAPKATIYNDYFEKAFLQPERYTTLYKGAKKGTPTWLKGYPFDLVIGNPPYGKNRNLYSSYFGKPKFAQLEMFFMYKSLELLAPGALLVFITASSFMRNDYRKEKEAIGKLAEFVDGYRMPKVFKNTQVPTDILVFKKK